jgi:hypothetical protein
MDIDVNDPATRQAAAELILEAAQAGDWSAVAELEKLFGQPKP